VKVPPLQALNSVRRNTAHSCKSPHRPEREREISLLAQRQHGNVTWKQLLGLGLSRGAIGARLESRRYVAVHKGVYCVGPWRDDPVSRAAGAVLACGDGAVLSHASAASLWGLVPRWSFPLEVTARGERERPGIVTHRCQSFQPRDVTRERGVPTTSRARTILDIAPRLTTNQLKRMVNDARRPGLLRLEAIRDVVERNRRHPGAKLLKPFAETTQNPTNSGFEDDLLAFTEGYGLPTPLINVDVNGRQADAYFPDHKLIVETDGWEFHNDRQAFESDRERDAENLRHGISTVRITRDRLTAEPDREAARLQQILESRRAPPRPS
jgi:hypothetical protein